MSWIEEAKRKAAEAAAAHVANGSVIGLGSGSTAKHFIEVIGSHLQSGELHNVIGVPTSFQAASEAVSAGIPLTSLDEHPELDLAVDGADQIDGRLHAIKGGGGALLREKVIASASVEYILIADERKLTQCLGDGCPLPIEVLPFSLGTVLRKVEKIGAEVVVRMGKGKLGPVVTDNGNFIVDADFGHIVDPSWLERELKAVPGVLETGLFLDIATLAYIGTPESVKEMRGPS
jgi:ribose 5-phosphate isomerase A